MKILKRGPAWTHKFTCRGCHSELEAEAKDLRFGEFGAIAYAGESGEWKYYVTCCVCDTDKTLKDSLIPEDVKKGVKKDR